MLIFLFIAKIPWICFSSCFPYSAKIPSGDTFQKFFGFSSSGFWYSGFSMIISFSIIAGSSSVLSCCLSSFFGYKILYGVLRIYKYYHIPKTNAMLYIKYISIFKKWIWNAKWALYLDWNIKYLSHILTTIFKCVHCVELKNTDLFQSTSKFRPTLSLCISVITVYEKYNYYYIWVWTFLLLY